MSDVFLTTPTLALLGQAYDALASSVGAECTKRQSASEPVEWHKERSLPCTEPLHHLSLQPAPPAAALPSSCETDADRPSALVVVSGSQCNVDAAMWTDQDAILKTCVQLGSQTSLSRLSCRALEDAETFVLADAQDLALGKTVKAERPCDFRIAQCVCDGKALVLGVCISAAEAWLPRRSQSAATWAEALCAASRVQDDVDRLLSILRHNEAASSSTEWRCDGEEVVLAPAAKGFGFVGHARFRETTNEVRVCWTRQPMVLLPSATSVPDCIGGVAAVCFRELRPLPPTSSVDAFSENGVETFLSEFTVACAHLLRGVSATEGAPAFTGRDLQCRIGGVALPGGGTGGRRRRVLRVSVPQRSGVSIKPGGERALLVDESTLHFFFPEIRHVLERAPFSALVRAATVPQAQEALSSGTDGGFGAQLCPWEWEEKRSNDAWADLPLSVFKSEVLRRALPTADLQAWTSVEASGTGS